MKVEQPARLERAINRAASKRERFATDRYNRGGHVVTASMRAPRFHHQQLPDEISLEEGGFLPSTLAELQRLGHKLTFFTVPTTGWTIAATIQRTPHGWEGKADPRLHGLAAGY